MSRFTCEERLVADQVIDILNANKWISLGTEDKIIYEALGYIIPRDQLTSILKKMVEKNFIKMTTIQSHQIFYRKVTDKERRQDRSSSSFKQ